MLPALLHNETDVSETVDMMKKKSLPALHNDGDVTETLAMLKSVGSMLDAVAAIDTAKTSRPITLDAITPEISSSLTPVRRPTRLEPIAPLQAAGAAVVAGAGRGAPAAAGTKFGPGVYVAESSSKPALDGKNTTARTAARGAANRLMRRMFRKSSVVEEPAARDDSLLAPPVITPPGGRITDDEVVITIEAEEGCTIEYRTDGVAPDEDGEWTGCCVYRGPLVLDEAGDLQVLARARKGDFVSAVTEANFNVSRVLRVLPKEVVSGVIRMVNASVDKTAKMAKKAFERALGRGLNTHVDVRVDETPAWFDVRFSADSENAAQSKALVTDLKSMSFVKRIALWLGREGFKVKEEHFKIDKVASHPLEVVKLHLDWTFPGNSSDFLDGSCLLLEQDACTGIVDYRGGDRGKKKVPKEAVSHSGDVMRANGGRHEITVHLPKVEKKVTDLFFTLSAYNCGDLSLFKAPSIRFFDAFDDTELADYTVSQCGGAQAVVLANLQRTAGGSWRVQAHGKKSSGTVRDYTPILEDIAPLVNFYDARRRRFWLVRLGALAAAGRLRTRARQSHEARFVEKIFNEVPESAFRQVVMFL